MNELKAEEAADAAAVSRGETPPERPPGRPVKHEDWYLADIEEDNAYVEKSRNGHVMRMSLQNVRFELLYESGIVATLVGFHREAVSSIAAALERFYEFAVEVFAQRAGVEATVQEAAWSVIKKNSERQFGAFQYLYLVNFKNPFMTKKEAAAYEEQFGFRNKVIHAGYFPNHKEVLALARYVYNLIYDLRAKRVELDEAAVEQVSFRHWRRGSLALEAKAGGPWKTEDGLYVTPGGAVLPMMLGSVIRGGPKDFDGRLADAKDQIWLWGFSRDQLMPD